MYLDFRHRCVWKHLGNRNMDLCFGNIYYMYHPLRSKIIAGNYKDFLNWMGHWRLYAGNESLKEWERRENKPITIMSSLRSVCAVARSSLNYSWNESRPVCKRGMIKEHGTLAIESDQKGENRNLLRDKWHLWSLLYASGILENFGDLGLLFQTPQSR